LIIYYHTNIYSSTALAFGRVLFYFTLKVKASKGKQSKIKNEKPNGFLLKNK